jgi:arylsulfatase A-like enzyme
MSGSGGWATRTREAASIGLAAAVAIFANEVWLNLASEPHSSRALSVGGLGLRVLAEYILVCCSASFLAVAAGKTYHLGRTGSRLVASLPAVLLLPIAVLVVEPAIGRTLLQPAGFVSMTALALLGLAASWWLVRSTPQVRDALPALAFVTLGALCGLTFCARRTLPSEVFTAESLWMLAGALSFGVAVCLPIAAIVYVSRRRPFGWRLTAVSALLAALVLGTIYFPSRTAPAHHAEARLEAGTTPSVLLIVIDTLRADFGTGTGDARDLVPSVQSLADDAVLFTSAYSAAPWTLPSFASLFTSSYPFDHGTGIRHPLTNARTALPKELPTFAESLSERGYFTGAVLTNHYLSTRYGLDRGFDAWELETQPLHRHTFARFLRRMGEAQQTHYMEAPFQTNRALGMIDFAARTGTPWLVLAHYMDPHTPYRGDVPVTPESRPRQYAQEVAVVDGALRELFEGLKSRGLYDDLLIVLTSDHGEELTDSRAETPLRADAYSPHGFSLFNELIHVPLAVKFPGNRWAGKVVGDPVSLVDVGPTIVTQAGAVPPIEFKGSDLQATILGEQPAQRVIFASGLMEREQMSAAIRGHHKLIAPHPEAGTADRSLAARGFDLRADPLETDPQDVDSPELSSLLEGISNRERRSETPLGSPVEIDPRNVKELWALGYIE